MDNKNKKTIISLVLAMTLIVIIIGFIVILGGKKEKKVSKEQEKPLEQNDVVIDGFTYSFLKLETKENNLVYSPLSVKYALSMLKEGANSKTKDEIIEVIGNEKPTKYENIENVLSLANSTFIRDTYKDEVKESFINDIKEKYNAEVIYDKFENADNVNNWIKSKTLNLIKNMLRDDQVKDSDVKMLLINALAIDMEWLKEFQSDNTTSRPFTKANGEKVDVAMMHKTSETNKFYQDEEYSVLSMPFKSYDDTNLEFITIMPNEKNLKEVLTSDNMNSTITTLLEKIHEPNNQELSISVPRFDFEYKTSLKEDLMKMGIKEAFEYTADFSNISDTGLRVDDILHKANIKCSEKGVKAAAVTVVIMKDNAIAFEPEQKEKIYLNFNKPFMFIIRDTKTNETWFVGTVYEPFLWENVKDDYEYR